MWTQYVYMKTVTVRDLRNNFSKVEAWLSEGEEIRIEKRGKPIGFISAQPRSDKFPFRKVDWEARRQAIGKNALLPSRKSVPCARPDSKERRATQTIF